MIYDSFTISYNPGSANKIADSFNWYPTESSKYFARFNKMIRKSKQYLMGQLTKF